MEKIDCTILGRTYSLMCEPEKVASLQQAINKVQTLTETIKSGSKAPVLDRVLVLAAIQLADDLLTLESPDGPMGKLAVGNYKRKIDEMNQTIGDIISRQDSLL